VLGHVRRTHACTHAHTHAHIHIHMPALIQIYTYTYTHIHILYKMHTTKNIYMYRNNAAKTISDFVQLTSEKKFTFLTRYNLTMTWVFRLISMCDCFSAINFVFCIQTFTDCQFQMLCTTLWYLLLIQVLIMPVKLTQCSNLQLQLSIAQLKHNGVDNRPTRKQTILSGPHEKNYLQNK
jgi:hypothetical protein